MLDNILEYQKKDAQQVALQKQLSESPAKKVVNQMVEYVRNAQQKLVQIEKRASELLVEFEELKNQLEKHTKTVDSLTKLRLDNMDEKELKNCENDTVDINAQILNIEKSISTLGKRISTILTEFEDTKRQGNNAKKKYEQGLKSYNELAGKQEPVIRKLQNDLANLEKTVDPKMLAKYKELRGDKKFPIFVPLMSNSCGGCSMELPSSKLDKIKATGMLECENCHRIIFVKD